MKNTKVLVMGALTALLAVGGLTGCNKNSGKDTYDKKGRLILNLKNVYFDAWEGEDVYTEALNDKFGVSVKASNYDFNSWDEMVNTAINGDNLTDVFHFNLKAYNFGSTYERWVDDLMCKALPDDLSKWPNLKSMLDNISNLDALKINGKLYCIPIANDITNPNKDFSNFTYVYRRDWAKKIDEENSGKAGYTPVYKEGDVYTWEEFERLVKAFATYVPKAGYADSDKACAMVDEKWGFPSVTNFFKDAPHCYTKDSNGKAINAFTSDGYMQGLEVAKNFVKSQYYSQDQYNFQEGTANKQYTAGLAAILYDNFNLANYITLRQTFKDAANPVPSVDDATALLKVKGDDGKFSLEGTENWFGATLFNYKISDTKMNKILDIIDYLLSEEGTRYAVYGKEGYDYSIVSGDDYDYLVGDKKIKLNPSNWEKNPQTGKYGSKPNGGKYLRYMATLGADTKPFDPFNDINKDAFDILNAWSEEMKTAKAANGLRVFKEPEDIAWMSTPTKNSKTESLLADANVYATKYAFNKDLTDATKYKAEFDKNVNWGRVLNEINAKLGK